MIVDAGEISGTRLRRAIRARTRMEERRAVAGLIDHGTFDPGQRAAIERMARRLISAIRHRRSAIGGIETFMREYGLTNREGVALMCLAEALLRIPDAETADRLIQEKIGDAAWQRHLGHSDSLLVNASTWGLMLTGGIVRLGGGGRDLFGTLGRLVARSGEPFIRESVRAAMRIIGGQFVMGRTIGEALSNAAARPGLRYSFDMLGEAAMTAADAAQYLARYTEAIRAVGADPRERAPADGSSLSVKLSALHPRFEFSQGRRVIGELADSLAHLAALARGHGIAITVDTEEAARLEPTLDVIDRALADDTLRGWDGLGVAVQAYQKRAPAVIDWLAARAVSDGRRIPVRLVKGAYWDSEIKYAQESGLDGYPVYTRKAATDLSYIACARRIFAADGLLAQFATHNAYTVAAVIELAREAGRAPGSFEFQRLHGMGAALYDDMAEASGRARLGGHPVRVYAPVGGHEDLLPYLVRRLLENGTNTSFVNRIGDDRAPISTLVADPGEALRARLSAGRPLANRRIALPADLFAPERRNSAGLDLNDPRAVLALKAEVEAAAAQRFVAAPIVAGRGGGGDEGAHRCCSPADLKRIVGTVRPAESADIAAALAAAGAAAHGWADTPAQDRAASLDRAAEAMESDRAALMALAMLEGGKSVRDALAEVREAVDLLRYYAARARADFAAPRALSGVTGEANSLSLSGRGVFACISPWNFPLAIFTGQIAAALAAGNAVIAKPAAQTPLIAHRAVGHLLAAGIPGEVLALLPGAGSEVGARLVADARISGVAFTGSTETAQAINRVLAAREGPITRFIAETGGQNAMIVDSSALPEQVVRDVITSAFLSAGQRCSALRILAVQDDVADRTLAMLAGAMKELRIGDPTLLSTDVGPVIDAGALATLSDHAASLARKGKVLATVPMPDGLPPGHWFAPMAVEIGRGQIPAREVFGPILHVLRYPSDGLDRVLDAIAATGYGLTLGVHSRIESTLARVRRRLRVGNTYVNRSMIGAMVGAQPFGGEGLSGTGPKAGGPNYLHGFAVERTLSVNVAAVGGNTELFAAADDEAD